MVMNAMTLEESFSHSNNNLTENYQIETSRLVTHLMVERVNNHDKIYDKSIEKSHQKHHAEIKKQKSRRNCEKLEEIKSFMNEDYHKSPRSKYRS